VQVPLSHQVDIVGFHVQAKRLLASQVPPHQVEWSAAIAQSVDEEPVEAGHACIGNRAARSIVPQSFMRISELVVLHHDAGRFDLLYRSLWRLVYEPELKHDVSDEDLARLRQMAQSVRRDIQKMKARLSFRPLQLKGHSVPFAWYEPTHFICETVGAVLAKEDPAQGWILLTPRRSLRWDCAHLLSAPAVVPVAQPQSATSDREWVRVLEPLAWV
jgi:probable DNA metabolism protein